MSNNQVRNVERLSKLPERTEPEVDGLLLFAYDTVCISGADGFGFAVVMMLLVWQR